MPDKTLLIFPFAAPIDGAGKMRDPAQGIYARSLARTLAERLAAGGTLQASSQSVTSHAPASDSKNNSVPDSANGDPRWGVANKTWSLEEACAIPLPEGTEHMLHGAAELTDRVRLQLLLVDQPRSRVELDHIVLRPRHELFQALDEAANAVAAAMGKELPAHEWPTRDVEAFVAYMRGRDVSAAHEAGVSVHEPQRSFDAYLEAIRRDPNFSEAQERMLTLALDFALAGQGPPQAARSACERLLQQDPTAYLAHAALAEIELGQDHPEAARAELVKLLKLRPDWTPAFERLGTALLRLREYEPALRWFDAALKERKDDPDTLAGRAATLAELRRFPEAIEMWLTLIRLGHVNVRVHENLARAYAALSQHTQAREHLQLARDLSGQPRFPFLLGLAYRAGIARGALGAFFRRLTSSGR